MTVSENPLRDLLRLIVWYPWRWLIELVPPKAGVRLLGMMGDLHFALSRGGRARLSELTAKLLASSGGASPDFIQSSVRAYFRNHYIDRLFIFIFPRLTNKNVLELADIDGLENLESALSKGRGVILVHGHFGPVHLPLVMLSLLGHRLKQIGLPSDEGLSWIGRNVAFRLRLKYEAMIPAEIINADSFLRPAFRWLKDNGVIMITGDGSGTERHVGKHIPFDFCGQRVLFPLGPSLLAQKTGAEMIPMFIVPGESKPYRIVIEKPVRVETGGDMQTMMMAEVFIKRYESYVRKYPGYMHFLDRFHHHGGIIAKDGQSSQAH